MHRLKSVDAGSLVCSGTSDRTLSLLICYEIMLKTVRNSPYSTDIQTLWVTREACTEEMGFCPIKLQTDEGEKEVQDMSIDSMQEPTDK